MNTGFIIFGQSRSGSTMLMELLDSHPDITCEGELLTKGWGYLNNRFLRHIVRRYPYPYFEARRRSAKIPVYGFKLLRHNMKDPGKCLMRMSKMGWKIIFVKRHNILRQALSNRIALQTNHWHLFHEQKDPCYTVKISLEDIHKELKMRKKWSHEEKEALKGLPYISIGYENDLCSKHNKGLALQRVFSVLDVGQYDLVGTIRKTDSRGYEEIIENHNELVSYISNTEYKKYLTNGQL